MNTMEPLSMEKKAETLKDIIENISAINNEMDSQLQMVADALARGGHPSNDKNSEEPLSIIASIRHERDKAEENLKLLISIREYLW